MGVLRRINEFNASSCFTIDHCIVCPQDRKTRIPFSHSSTIVYNVFDLVHMNVWCPYKVTTNKGMRYFLTLVDDKSRWS